MWKIKSILVSLLAIATLANCSDDNDNGPGGGGDEKNYDVAYMSISLSVPKGPQTRVSGEEPAVGTESDINKLYVVTFGADGKTLVKDDKTDNYVIILGSTAIGTENGVTTPNNPIKVSTKTHFLLVVANPGAVLAKRLEDLADTDKYDDIIGLLKIPADPLETTNKYIVKEVVHDDGYTMINVGFFDESDPTPSNHAWKENCLLDVSGNIVLASDHKTDAAAQAAAKSNPAKLEIERLAAKLEVTVASALKVAPFKDGDDTQSLGQFAFEKWAIDHYNSLLFPYAVKSTTVSSHSASTPFYKSNFYTKDPNYDETSGANGYLTDIVKNVVDANLVPQVDWTDKSSSFGSNYKYCTENTMAAEYQKFGAATRLVLRAQYVPGPEAEGFVLGNDWFYLSNGADSKTFATFDALLAVYNPAKLIVEGGGGSALEKRLVGACDKFYNQIRSRLTTDPGSFANLTQTILDGINTENGGELSKVDGCLYWYQKSINYYYYEIRHDNEADGHMQFGKYGVVRNNYYMLNLTKVNGQGTPWYPGGGPEDPDEEEDIDKLGAYLHFEIKVAPWIKWETDFEI